MEMMIDFRLCTPLAEYRHGAATLFEPLANDQVFLFAYTPTATPLSMPGGCREYLRVLSYAPHDPRTGPGVV